MDERIKVSSIIIVTLKFDDCEGGVGVLSQPDIFVCVVRFTPRVHIKRILIELFAEMDRNNLLRLELSPLKSYELQL